MMTQLRPSAEVPAAPRTPPSGWRIALFGPVRAIHDCHGATVFRTQRAKSMLALLVDANGAPLSRLHIADLLWRESATGLVNLASELFYLRKRFDQPGQPFFVAEDKALRVPPDRYVSDAAEFEAALAAADAAADAQARIAALDRAVTVYTAPFAQDVYDDWTDARRQDLADACIGALVRLAEAHLAAGRPDASIGPARRALGFDACDSRAAVALLHAYRDAGANGRARAAADEIEAAFRAEGLAMPTALRHQLGAIRSGPQADPSPDDDPVPVLGAMAPSPSPSPSHSTPAPAPAPAAAPASLPPRPLPAGTLTFLVADEAPAARRLARTPVRGEAWLPKSEQAKRNAAPDDPAAAGRERDDARRLAWQLFDHRVREAAGHIVAPHASGSGTAGDRRRVAVFTGSLDAVEAAAATFEALASQPPEKRDKATTPQLRMALLTIEASPTGGSSPPHSATDGREGGGAFPYGEALADRLARLLDAASGWQVLCSNATAALVAPEQHLNIQRRVERLGLVRLAGEASPQAIHVLHYGGSEGYRFPPPDGLLMASGAAALRSSTSFVGRSDDLAALGAWIADPGIRLITLKGLGGIGKTRLALEAAEAQRDRLAVWSVSLVDLRDGALVAGEVVKALGETVPAGVTAEDVIVQALSRRPSLLVLDNLEHLLTPAVALIDRLLAGDRVPSLTILATSRDVLKHSAEHVYDVAPLPVPDARPRPVPVLPPRDNAPSDDPVRANDSVRLFAARATAKRAAFALTDDAMPDVARLVTLLEGIPLAIELAAAKIAVLSPAQMADQIESHVRGGRYGLLKGAARDAPDRHQSLQAAMDWSWALLTPEQRRFLASLSVFRGGMTLEAAAYVTEDPEALDHLLALVDASLLQRVDVEGEREPRFGMLETVREYGSKVLLNPIPLTELGLSDSIPRARFIEHFSSLILDSEPIRNGGPTQALWLDAIGRDYANCAQLLEWLVDHGEQRDAIRRATGLYGYWLHRGYLEEGSIVLKGVLNAAGGSTKDPVTVEALMARASLLWQSGRIADSLPILDDCVAALRDNAHPMLLSRALHNLASMHYDLGRMRIARDLFEQSLKLKTASHHIVGASRTLYNLALIDWRQCHFTSARQLLSQSLDIADELDDCVMASSALHALSVVSCDIGDYVGASEYLNASGSRLSSARDPHLTAYHRLASGDLQRALGSGDRARTAYAEASEMARLSGVRYLELIALCRLSETEIESGQHRGEKQLVAALDALEGLGQAGVIHRHRALLETARIVSGSDNSNIHMIGSSLDECSAESITRDSIEIIEFAAIAAWHEGCEDGAKWLSSAALEMRQLTGFRRHTGSWIERVVAGSHALNPRRHALQGAASRTSRSTADLFARIRVICSDLNDLIGSSLPHGIAHHDTTKNH